MCQRIVVDRGESELESIQDFKDYFKVDTFVSETDVVDECCLCQIDIAKELNHLKVPFVTDFSDFYIGKDLEQITF